MFSTSQSIFLSFLLAFSCMIVFPIYLPQLTLISFAPIITICYSKYSLQQSMMLALLAGFLLDIFSSFHQIGHSSLNFMLMTLMLHRYRSYFYLEKPHTFCIYIFLFSVLSTTVQLVQLYFFHISLNWTPLACINNLILMPFLDSLYGLLFYFYPHMIIKLITQTQRINRYKQIILKYRIKLIP